MFYENIQTFKKNCFVEFLPVFDGKNVRKLTNAHQIPTLATPIYEMRYGRSWYSPSLATEKSMSNPLVTLFRG